MKKGKFITAEDLARKLGAYEQWNTVEMHLEHLLRERKIKSTSMLVRGYCPTRWRCR